MEAAAESPSNGTIDLKNCARLWTKLCSCSLSTPYMIHAPSLFPAPTSMPIFFFYLSVSCLLFYLVGLSHYIPSFLWRPINPEWNCLVKYNFNKRSTCCVSFYYYLLFLRLDVIVLFNYTFF